MIKIDKKPKQVGRREHWLRIVIILPIAGAMLLAGLAGCGTATPVPTNTPTTEPPTPTSGPEETPAATREPLIPLDDDPVLGSPDAPVNIIEYSDYLCPYCGRFVIETMPRIEEEYIDQGQVKLTFRDFPVHGQLAILGAMVAECAGEQDKFWEMHVLLFERAGEWAQSDDFLATFGGYAGESGIDGSELLSCLQAATPLKGIQEDYNLALQDGITGTPSFLINGTLVVGAQPFEEFQRVIEEELAKSR